MSVSEVTAALLIHFLIHLITAVQGAYLVEQSFTAHPGMTLFASCLVTGPELSATGRDPVFAVFSADDSTDHYEKIMYGTANEKYIVSATPVITENGRPYRFYILNMVVSEEDNMKRLTCFTSGDEPIRDDAIPIKVEGCRKSTTTISTTTEYPKTPSSAETQSTTTEPTRNGPLTQVRNKLISTKSTQTGLPKTPATDEDPEQLPHSGNHGRPTVASSSMFLTIVIAICVILFLGS